MVRDGHAERRLFARGVEIGAAEQPVEARQRRLKLVQQPLSFRSRLVTGRASDEQVIAEHIPQALQCAAHRRLTEHQSSGGARDIPLFCERGEDHQQVEIGLAYMLQVHIVYRHYALDL